MWAIETQISFGTRPPTANGNRMQRGRPPVSAVCFYTIIISRVAARRGSEKRRQEINPIQDYDNENIRMTNTHTFLLVLRSNKLK